MDRCNTEGGEGGRKERRFSDSCDAERKGRKRGSSEHEGKKKTTDISSWGMERNLQKECEPARGEKRRDPDCESSTGRRHKEGEKKKKRGKKLHRDRPEGTHFLDLNPITGREDGSRILKRKKGMETLSCQEGRGRKRKKKKTRSR